MSDNRDLFGKLISPKEISINVYHDEREIPDRWLYHSFLLVPISKENEVIHLLLETRKKCKWDKEIHFIDLKETAIANDLAMSWLELFAGMLPRHIYFYFLGIDYKNLEKRVWEKRSSRDHKIYNRFFEIGLHGSLKWFFLHSKSEYKKVVVENIFSDAKSRKSSDKFHQQAIREIESNASQKNENICFNCTSILDIDSDHEKEIRFQHASHLIQFVDLISGALSQSLDATSSHLGKHLCAKKLLSHGLPGAVMGYQDQNFQSPYYKRFAMSFFPIKKLSKEEILLKRYTKNLFFTSRKLQYLDKVQKELL